MIGCDFCGEWYHGCCVGVSEEESNRIEVYKCQLCTEHHIATPFYNEGQRYMVCTVDHLQALLQMIHHMKLSVVTHYNKRYNYL